MLGNHNATSCYITCLVRWYLLTVCRVISSFAISIFCFLALCLNGCKYIPRSILSSVSTVCHIYVLTSSSLCSKYLIISRNCLQNVVNIRKMEYSAWNIQHDISITPAFTTQCPLEHVTDIEAGTNKTVILDTRFPQKIHIVSDGPRQSQVLCRCFWFLFKKIMAN